MKPLKIATTFAALFLLVSNVFGAADLVPTKLQFQSNITNSPLSQIKITWALTNQGDLPVAGFWNALYISTNSTLDDFAPLLQTWYFGNSIAAGASYSKTELLQLPVGYSGNYYIFFRANLYNFAQESDYNNNVLAAPLAFTAVPSDLAIQSASVPNAATVPPNPLFTLTWAVTNLGPGVASGTWFDNVYLSTNAALSDGAMALGPFFISTSLQPGQVLWQTNQVRLPITTSGDYYLIFATDLYNSLFELNTNNNHLAFPISFTVNLPDLAALPLQVATSITSLHNPVLPIIWGATNVGPVVAQGYWNDSLFLSTNGVLDEQSAQLLTMTYENGPAGPGTSYRRTNSYLLPVQHSGTYYLFYKADSQNSLLESNLANNVSVQAITFDIHQPDLVPISFQVPTVVTSAPNPLLKLSWGVTNQGNGATSDSWFDQVYLSKVPIFDASATNIFGAYEGYPPLDSGDTYWRTNLIQIPVTQDGNYYLIFRTDGGNSLNESDTNNNTVIKPIAFTLQPPNLAPVALQLASPTTTPPNPIIQIVWGVTNRGVGAALGNWYDRIYLSTDAQLDASDQQVLIGPESNPVLPGGSYWRTNSTQLSITQSGTYYLIFSGNNDSYYKIFESDYSDNLKAVPVTFNIQPPDLVPILSRLPAKITGPPFPTATVVWGITNQGTGAAQNMTWTDGLYLSSDPTLHPTDPILAAAYEYNPIPPGGVVWMTNDVLLPAAANSTNYFIAKANLYNALFESDYNNNLAVLPVVFEIRPPDLAPIALQIPSVLNGPPNPRLTVVWGVTNQGTGDAIGHYAWYDHLYVSTNAVWDNTAMDVFSTGEQGPITPGDAYWRTNTVRLPITSSGSYYLFLKLNLHADMVESDYSNDVAAVGFTFNVRPPDLAPVAIQVPSSVTGPPYPSLTYVWGVTNQGGGTAEAYYSSWLDAVSFSTNDFWDLSNYQLSSTYQYGPVLAGDVYWHTNTLRMPITQSGTYYLYFYADQSQDLLESDYDNNLAVVPVTFTIQPPDLAPVALLAPTNLTSPPNPILSVAWGVTNQGIGPAIGFNQWYDAVYFSTDPVWSPHDQLIAFSSENGPIFPGQTYWRTNSVQLPAPQSGIYYFFFRADNDDTLLESNEANNAVVVPVTLNIQPPDLTPVPPTSPLTVTGPPNPAFSLVWGVTNQGTGRAVPGWNDGVYLSKNPTFDPVDTQLSLVYETIPVDPGTVAYQTNDVWAPVTQSGSYYLIFNTDVNQSLYESDYGNNLAVVPITFNIQHPDLAPIAVEVPAQITDTPNPVVEFHWGITNLGPGAATSPYSSPSWSDELYLSTNSVLDETAQPILSDRFATFVPAGGFYWRTNFVTVPVTQNGTYYFILRADDNSFLFESDYNNNTLAVPVTFTIQPPDLAPTALLASMVITSTPNPRLSVVWSVTNQGIGTAKNYWYDALYLSTNSVMDNNAAQVYWQSESGPLPVGTNYWRTNVLQLPAVHSGSYFLLFTANAGHTLFESNFTNNSLAIPLTLTILPPDLQPLALKAPAVVTAPPNPSVLMEWGVTNYGPGAALVNAGTWGWSDRIYLSPTPTLGIGISSAVTSRFEQGPIGPAGQYWRSQWIQIPVTASGSYYLIFVANADLALSEVDPNNNTLSVPITFNIQQPDLTPLSLQVPGVVSGLANPTVKITWAVTNQGSGAATASWQDYLYLSKDAVLDSADTVISSQSHSGLPAGSGYWRSQNFQVPIKESGKYYIILQTGVGTLTESAVNNNTLAVPVTFNLSAPDLAPIAFEVPSQITTSPNPTISMIWGVTNQGPGAASKPTNGSWYDLVYFSTNSTLNPQYDVVVFSDYSLTHVSPGEAYWRTNLIRLPATNNGPYFLHFRANADTWQPLYETDYSNNIVTAPISLNLQAPNLSPVSLQGPTTLTGAQLQLVTFIWSVTNQGPGVARGETTPWHDLFRLTRVNPANGSTQFITSWGVTETPTVNPGETYWNTNSILFPVVEPGVYQVTLSVDVFNDLGESNSTNNEVTMQLTVSLTAPDVTPIELSAPAAITGPPYPLATVIWGVTNQSISAAVPSYYYYSWLDSFYLSTNAFFDQAAIPVASFPQNDFIQAGGRYWRTNTMRLPVSTSGKYYLLLDLDIFHSLKESDETNNFASFPIMINVLPAADLQPLALQAPSTFTGPPNSELTFVWGVTNQSTSPAQSVDGWYDNLSISIAPPPNDTDSVLAVFNETNELPPGGVYWRTNTVTTRVANSGQYYFVFRTDFLGNLFESDYGNNAITVPITFNIQPPDLAPFKFVAPVVVNGAPNASVSVVVGVTNQGPGTALPGTDAIYISSTPFIDSSAQIAVYQYRSTPIPAGGVYWITNSVRLPVVDSGNYYLIFAADLDNALGESEFLNNFAATPLRLDLSLQSDLALHEFQSPSVVVGSPNPRVQLVWHVVNEGLGPAVGARTDKITFYPDTNPYFEVPISSISSSDALPVGLGYWRTNRFTLPITQSGTCYLSLEINSGGGVPELDYNNNNKFVAINVIVTNAQPSGLAGVEPRTDGTFQLRVSATPGGAYTLEASTNLLDWTRVMDFMCTNATTWLTDPEASNFHERFYRLAPYLGDYATPLVLDFGGQSPEAAAGLGLKLDGPLTGSYRVQVSTNLADWTTITNFPNIQFSPVYFRDTFPGSDTRRFYRAVSP